MLRFEGGIGDRTGTGGIIIKLVTSHPMLPCKLGLAGVNDSVLRPFFSVLVTSVYTTTHYVRFSHLRSSFALASLSE